MSPREEHVKIFLSCCDCYSRGYYGQNVEPFWVWKGSFMGLLNLGQQIQTYGNLRWYWEGTHEKFIQPVKTVLVLMREGTYYLEKKFKLIQKLNALHLIGDTIREWEDNNEILMGRLGRRYKKRAGEKSKRVSKGKRRE